jgi:hypothetical protein
LRDIVSIKRDIRVDGWRISAARQKPIDENSLPRNIINVIGELPPIRGFKTQFTYSGGHSRNVSLLGLGRGAALYVQASRPKSAAPFPVSKRF